MEDPSSPDPSLVADLLGHLGGTVFGFELRGSDAVLTYWGPGAEKLFGWEASDVDGKPLSELLTGPGTAAVPEITRRVSGGRLWKGEIAVRHRDGYDKLLHATVGPATGDGDTIRGGLGVVLDLSERVSMESALKASMERLEAQFRGFPVPTYTRRVQGDELVLVDYNDAARTFTGGLIDKSVGARLLEFYADEPRIVEQFEECVRTRGHVHADMNYRLRSTGLERYLEVDYVFIPPDIVMVHTTDFTHRQRLLEALEEEQAPAQADPRPDARRHLCHRSRRHLHRREREGPRHVRNHALSGYRQEARRLSRGPRHDGRRGKPMGLAAGSNVSRPGLGRSGGICHGAVPGQRPSHLVGGFRGPVGA